MTGEPEGLSRHDLEAKIVKRCWEDERFRKEFIANPAGTFTKYLRVPAASLPKIIVHEETPGSWHIVLSPKPVNTGELSDAELEKVAGGMTTVVCSGVSISLVSTVTAAVSLEEGGW